MHIRLTHPVLALIVLMLPDGVVLGAGSASPRGQSGAMGTSIGVSAGTIGTPQVRGTRSAYGPWSYTYMPRLGFEVAHDGRYYLLPAVYDPERRRLSYLGYPAWGVSSGWGWSSWSPYGWPAGTWAWPYPNDYAGDPLYEVPRRVEPRPTHAAPEQQTPAPVVPTLVELGAEAMHLGEFDRAAAIYERLDRERRESEASAPVAPSPDRTALRLRALALAGAGRHSDARAALERAVSEDPSASGGRIDAAAALGGTVVLRRAVVGAVRYAQSAAAPDAWRYVATMMDFEGRPKQAEAMRRRAAALERKPATTAENKSPAAHGPASFRMPAPIEAVPSEPDPAAPSPEWAR